MSIDLTGVLLLVLGTAVLHAAWNVMAKSIEDRWVSAALIGTTTAAIGIGLITLFGVPPARSWPYLVASAVLQAGYLVMLTTTYAHGDLSRLYPIVRGTSPVVVTVVAVTVLAERLSLLSTVGLVTLVAGIALLATARGLPRADTGLALALATGVMIAGYSLSDGVGVRLAHETGAYIGWMFALQAPTLLVVCRWRSGPTFWHRMRVHAPLGMAGGVLSATAYGTTVWAQSRAPLALVAALRETSVVWGVLIGGLVLGERLTRTERAAVLAVAAGAVVLQLGA